MEDIKGVIHAHSTYSDGANSLKDMALACKKIGYEYLVISDHSKAAAVANGLDEKRLNAQIKEIEKNIPKYTPRCGNELFSERNELKPLYDAIYMGIK